jgi:hypothetical protein
MSKRMRGGLPGKPRLIQHNISANGPCLFTDSLGNQSLLTRFAYNDLVAHGPRIKGDYHHPNPWNYVTEALLNAKGTLNDTSDNSRYEGHLSCNLAYYALQVRTLFDNDPTYNSALSRVFNTFRGGLDLGLDLVEAKQTTNMFKNVGRVLSYAKSGLWKSFAKQSIGNKSRSKGIKVNGTIYDRKTGQVLKPKTLGTTKDLANGWLEWQYGWHPLVNDLYESVDQLRRTALNKLQNVEEYATYKPPLLENFPLTLEGNDFGYKVKGKLRVKTKINCSFLIDDPGIANFTSLNPVSLGWEVIPYSFVVDWFYNIGGYLRSLETCMIYASRFHSGYITRYVEIDNEIQFTESPDHRFISNAKARYIRRECDRTILYSIPTPHPPVFQVKLGWERLLSAASLLRQLLK